ncbi:hypothetical protein GCM10009720_08750 [Yaniella flava]|uniref:Uncharacterized protein n=1 Tax=Yaniella flava TaxID=287930 RepID=A0ABN2U8G6_9MICC
MNPTERPVQPKLPPLTTRREKRNAEYVKAVRTGELDVVPQRRSGKRAQPLSPPTSRRAQSPGVEPSPQPATRSQNAVEPAAGTRLATSRRAKRGAAKAKMNLMDKALIGVVAMVGLLMLFMGIVGIVASFQGAHADVISLFTGSITALAGASWTAVAPFKVIETTE